jgi:hypothetical protein
VDPEGREVWKESHSHKDSEHRTQVYLILGTGPIKDASLCCSSITFRRHRSTLTTNTTIIPGEWGDKGQALPRSLQDMVSRYVPLLKQRD